MTDARRFILESVARGELSPEEGARQLEEADPPEPVGTGAAGATSTVTARRIRIERTAGNIQVVGDARVQGYSVEGPHSIREEAGGTVVIQGGGFETGFRLDRRRRRGWDFGFDREVEKTPLRVRVQPDTDIVVSAQAGVVRIEGMHGSIEAAIAAGTASIGDFRGPLDVSITAGTLRAQGVLARGRSHVRCDAGTVVIGLERGSSVRVRATNNLGKVVLGDESGTSIGGGTREWTVGTGDALLEVDSQLGSVRVAAL